MKFPRDRRAVAFVIFSGLSMLLVPLAPDDLRWVGVLLGVVYIVLAALSWFDNFSRSNSHSVSSIKKIN